MATRVRFSSQKYLMCNEPLSHQRNTSSPRCKAIQPARHDWDSSSPLSLELHLRTLAGGGTGFRKTLYLMLRTFQDLQAAEELLVVEQKETHSQVGLRLGSVPVVCRESNI